MLVVNPYLHQNLMPFISFRPHHFSVPASIFQAIISPCNHLRDLPRYENDNFFFSVTLHWIYNYNYKNKVFWIPKWYLVKIIILLCPWNTDAFSVLGASRVTMFSHLYFKCRQTRGRLRNSPNDCRKLYINSVRSSKRKLDLEKNQFWEYLCLDIQIARAVTALSLTLSTNLGTTCTYNIYIHIYIYIYI